MRESVGAGRREIVISHWENEGKKVKSGEFRVKSGKIKRKSHCEQSDAIFLKTIR
jgi:hypothetical protein